VLSTVSPGQLGRLGLAGRHKIQRSMDPIAQRSRAMSEQARASQTVIGLVGAPSASLSVVPLGLWVRNGVQPARRVTDPRS